MILVPRGLHDVVGDSLQRWLGGKHPRRLAHILLPGNTDVHNDLTGQTENLHLVKGLRASNKDSRALG